MKKPTKRVTKRISDKERLDWMQRNEGDTEYVGDGLWEVHDFECEVVRTGKTLRQAIDAAIRAERGKRGPR